MRTIRLWLKPHPVLPAFQQLEWEFVDVTLEDVLERGIHPWMRDQLPHDMVDAFLQKLNDPACEPPALAEYHFTHDLHNHTHVHSSNRTRFEQALDHVQQQILFCDQHLDFPRLLQVATEKLRDEWNSGTALVLAERMNIGFQELRQFLKTKDKSVKLKGYGDLADYNWGAILSLDDFRHHERLLIEEAINPLNLRTPSFLEHVTDERGRLRLAPTIDHLTLTQRPSAEYASPIIWECGRKGTSWRLRAGVGGSRAARRAAQGFGARWSRDEGRLCFRAATQDIVNMVDSGEMSSNFPGLRYTTDPYVPEVVGQVAKSNITLFMLGGYPRKGWSGERLKDILREYGVSTTGVKAVLVEKLAALAASEYEAHAAHLSCYFTENPFVRVAREIRQGEFLPVLSRDNILKGLLLHLYVLRHLRGNVVIDPSHGNDTCSIKDMAHALITGRVTFLGALLRTA